MAFSQEYIKTLMKLDVIPLYARQAMYECIKHIQNLEDKINGMEREYEYEIAALKHQVLFNTEEMKDQRNLCPYVLSIKHNTKDEEKETSNEL